MPTARTSRGALVAVALSTTLTSTACAPTTTGLSRPDVTARMLPRVDDVIRAPAPRPVPRKGDDARLFARRALDYGDANGAALVDGRAAYERVRDELASPGAQP